MLQRPDRNKWELSPADIRSKILESAQMGDLLQIEELPTSICWGNDLLDTTPSPQTGPQKRQTDRRSRSLHSRIRPGRNRRWASHQRRGPKCPSMIFTNLVIASMNVRSLGQGIQGVRKRRKLRNFFRKAEPQPQVLLLQEHCYCIEDCMEQLDQLQFRGGTSIWNNATYSADGGRFSGGTGISLSRELSDRLLESAVLVEARCQYIILDINGDRIGILNIYAPNCTGKQAVFCQAHWIVAGDFNMTELGEDRSQGSSFRNMGPRELSAWSRFVLHLGLSDVFQEFHIQPSTATSNVVPY